jgi:hypothetical protein
MLPWLLVFSVFKENEYQDCECKGWRTLIEISLRIEEKIKFCTHTEIRAGKNSAEPYYRTQTETNPTQNAEPPPINFELSVSRVQRLKSAASFN